MCFKSIENFKKMFGIQCTENPLYILTLVLWGEHIHGHLLMNWRKKHTLNRKFTCIVYNLKITWKIIVVGLKFSQIGKNRIGVLNFENAYTKKRKFTQNLVYHDSNIPFRKT